MSSLALSRALVVVLLLLGACAAPPTPQQATSRAVKRNCETRAEAAAEAVRGEHAAALNENAAAGNSASGDIESRAAAAREAEFRACMLESAL